MKLLYNYRIPNSIFHYMCTYTESLNVHVCANIHLYVGGSLLLSSDQTDSSISIDMDSVARRQQQMQIIEQQVHYNV